MKFRNQLERTSRWVLTLLFVFLTANSTWAQSGTELLEATQKEDIEKVKSLLAAGVDVNATNDYGATALFFACDRGNRELVKILLKAGASPNFKDRFYQATPVTWAMQKNHQDLVIMLLKSGVSDADAQLMGSVQRSNLDYVKALVDSQHVSDPILYHARLLAKKRLENDPDDEDRKAILELLQSLNVSEPGVNKLSEQERLTMVGDYQAARFAVSVSSEEDELRLSFRGGTPRQLTQIGPTLFLDKTTPVRFAIEDEKKVLYYGSNKLTESKIGNNGKAPSPPKPPEMVEAANSSSESLAADRAISSSNWPAFRGYGSRGVGEGQNPPLEWNVPEKKSTLWKTEIPGLGLSCPSIWEDRIFVTSAVNPEADSSVKIGLYGDVASVEEDFEYEFNVYCVQKSTGKVLWNRTAHKGKPAVKRHAKSSHANPTVATDGKHVVAFFGSEGLYCYTMDGELIWKKSFGLLDSGWFYDAGYQWGFGSSPVISEDKVFVQCDIQKNSFVAALSLNDGSEIWKKSREEIPGWSSPTVHQFDEVKMLLTHGTKAARGYDADSGELLWTLPRHSEIVVPTPFVAHDLIYIASGYSPIQPIFAIRPSARGTIEMGENESSNDAVAWSYQRGGPYMPSPIVYGDFMYCCNNSGILSCYEAQSGKQVYRKRLRAPGSGSLSFTASPIAGDGKIYLPAEDGRVLVVKAGPKFELLKTNPTGESILATPAISDGKLILRTVSSLIAVGESIQESK